QHRSAQDDPLGALTDRGHPRQRERRVAALVTPRLEVIADRRAVHAVRFGLDAQFDELARGELLRRRLVSQFEFSHVFVSTPLPRLAGWHRSLPSLFRSPTPSISPTRTWSTGRSSPTATACC